MLNVFINGIEAQQEPTGVKDLAERIYFSTELGGYLTEVRGAIEFYGDEYEYLKGLMRNQICDSVALVITDSGSFVPVFNGKMFLTDMVWHPDKSMVECEVLDDGYLATIDGNKEIEAVLNVGKSKNGVAITSLALGGLQFWNETRSLNYTNRSGMRVGDALEFLVDFMTDGEVGFVSDFFDTNAGTHPQYFDMVCTGITMRDGTATYPKISFDGLFKDLQKIYNLAFAVERTADGVRMRIEPKSYFYKEVGGTVFNNVHSPVQNVRRESFYAKVDFGSSQIGSEYTYYPDIPFSGVGQENYHLAGECNLNTQLSLRLSTLITDTNIIQDVLPSGTANEGYDEETFLVRFDSLNGSYDAMTIKPGSATDYYYNEPYSNYRLSERWFDQIPQSIFSFLGGGNDQAMATQTAAVHLYSSPSDCILNCDDDSTGPNEDPSNNYTSGALTFDIPSSLMDGYGLPTLTRSGTGGYYTAPINGMYNVTVELTATGGWFDPLGLIRVNSSNVAVDFPWQDLLNVSPTWWFGPIVTDVPFVQNHTFFMEAGDYVTFVMPNNTNIEISDATFKVLDPLGGEWQTNDSKDVRLIETAFDYDIAQSDWNDIKDDPFRLFKATFNTGFVNGWISEMERNRLTGRGSVRILSKP